MSQVNLRRPAFLGVLAAAVIAIGTLSAAVAFRTTTASSPAPPEPGVRLMAAQRQITVTEYGGSLLLDPGIWVSVSRSSLEFDVDRTGYGRPLTITQIMTGPGIKPEARPLPASVLDGWNGLKDFIHLSVLDSAGKVVDSLDLTVCPNSYNPEPASPDTTGTDPYPQWCTATDPFELTSVWGIPAGWAVDPTEVTYNEPTVVPEYPVNLSPGTYTVTETIRSSYVRMFHVSSSDATATVAMTVVKGQAGSVEVPGQQAATGQTPGSRQPSSTAQVPTVENPPSSTLPDLVPLPAWEIRAVHALGSDLLEFNATVWVGGNGPLDVEAFRDNGSPAMPAYQYFWRNGRVIGRARVGTMGFYPQAGYDNWHFQQFAQYQLLGADKKLVVRSHKLGFCIGPTDPVDLLLPRATWRPAATGLSGQCGQPTTLWVQEVMPVGWGDTYDQILAGQAFDISNLPNGTYYIEIIANPAHILHETNTGNDISLREVILGGTPGHRNATVPAFDGIDPEG